MNQALLEFIRETVTPENMKLQEPMAAHTTFRTGGEAAVFVEVPGKQQLTQLVQYMAKISQEFFVLGKGSNLLVGDKGYPGIVLNLGKRFARIEVEGNIIRAEAGASLPQVAVTASAARTQRSGICSRHSGQYRRCDRYECGRI